MSNINLHMWIFCTFCAYIGGQDVLPDFKDTTTAENTTKNAKAEATTFYPKSTKIGEKDAQLDAETLVSEVTARRGEYQSFDGWYNNRGRPSFGSADSTLIRLLPSAYEDGVFKPVKKKKDANPLKISEMIMGEKLTCDSCSSSCSKTGKNVLMVFFGLFVVEEILNSRRPSCPPEYFNIEIPANHSFSKVNIREMPFIRTNYDKNSGSSPNNPRKQINSATPWIDGSAIYGTSKSVSDALRSYKYGQLESSDPNGYFPALNNGYLPMLLPMMSQDTESVKRTMDSFKVGNSLSHENPFTLIFNVLFFRWHNKLSHALCEQMTHWKDEDCFVEARKWVIATLQHIIVDEWLPELLGEKLPPYKGYNPAIDPGISHVFQSAAMRFGHTLVPSGIYYSGGSCYYNKTRLCNSYYEAKEMLMNNDIDAFLQGMAFQSAENEDMQIVDDLRKYLYGPVEFTKRDLMALNIQRGRDHGLPGYGEVKKTLQPEKKHFGSFSEMASECNPEFRNIIEHSLKDFYESVDDVDLWIGGLLESDHGPGPLFKIIIKEQFLRIRDGDRFWFQNKDNGLFSDRERTKIEKLTLYDIVLDVTVSISDKELHQELFHVPYDDVTAYQRLKCSDNLIPYSCIRSQEQKNCYALPPLKEYFGICPNVKKVEKCKETEPKTYDYFLGSGTSFVLTFLFLFFFIIGCIITLIVMIKRRQKSMAKVQESIKIHKRKTLDENSMYASEWIDQKEGTREIIVRFNAQNKHLNTYLLNNQALRSIDLNNVQMIELQVSVGGNEHYTVIRLAREYDLLLKFNILEQRENFIEKLEAFLGGIGVGRQRREMNLQNMFKNAVTKADRQVQLEKFFRVVFAQAFSIEHNQDELLDIDSNQAREIIHTELTAYEFADALSLRPDAMFVKQMFELVDSDGNGYISFREFLNMIIIFAKGSPEDKTKLMFDIYDVDHSGKLTRLEFSRMIRSMLELANQSLSSDKIDQLITSFFKAAGLKNKQELTFQDFLHLLSDHREELGYMQLSFDVGRGFKAAPSSSARHSVAYRAHETVARAYSASGEEKTSKTSRVKSHIVLETKPEVYEKDLTKQKVYKGIRFIENYKLHIFWMLLYTLICFGIFIERAYYYSVEREHTGLRKIAGYGVTVTRGAASVMMFTFSTLLLSMCRNIITFLRETFLHKYIPFDAAILFHKYVAVWALIFSVMHIIGHAINFYHISTQPFSDLQCLLREFHLVLTKMPKFQYWCFATITGSTGVLLVITLALMYVFAVQPARRYVFNAFWKTHNLYPILYFLMILHGMGRLVNDPIFYYYFVGPCVLFTLDRLISVSRKKVEISVVKAELLPSGVTHLEFKKPADFEYRSGQWVRVACSVLNDNEYHPFTLSSAPHEENLSLHIRAVGPWTSNLRKIYDPNILQNHAYPKIFLDGPYGEGHQDWFRYEISVLVGGGIGITPFASILKDVVFKSSVKVKIACKKLYFIWVTRTQKHFEWMTDIIREVEENDRTGLVDVHIFITQFYGKFDLRTTMLYICERHFQRVSGRSLFTGLHSITHFGRPDFKLFFNSLQQEHPDVNKIAVFSCGPPMMTRGVQLSCEELNKHEGAIFVHHYENF